MALDKTHKKTHKLLKVLLHQYLNDMALTKKDSFSPARFAYIIFLNFPRTFFLFDCGSVGAPGQSNHYHMHTTNQFFLFIFSTFGIE